MLHSYPMKSTMTLHTCNFEYLQADQPGHLGDGRAFLFEKEDPCKTLEISKKDEKLLDKQTISVERQTNTIFQVK